MAVLVGTYVRPINIHGPYGIWCWVDHGGTHLPLMIVCVPDHECVYIEH